MGSRFSGIKTMTLPYVLMLKLGIEYSLIFSYLDEQSRELKLKGQLCRGGYFYRSYENIAAACFLGVKEVEEKLETLEIRGYIKTKIVRRKWASFLHYKVDLKFLKSQEFDCREDIAKSERYWVKHKSDCMRILKTFTPSPPPRESKTYIMFDGHTKLFKIGKSLNPTARERTLCGEVPKIKLLFIKERDIESRLHTAYSHKRYRGEWFKLSLEEVVKIADDYGFEAVY